MNLIIIGLVVGIIYVISLVWLVSAIVRFHLKKCDKKIVNEYTPDYVSKPGETILELLEYYNISIKNFQKHSEEYGLNISVIKLLDAEIPITEEIAEFLENEIKVPAHFWINRERHYRENLNNQQKVETQ